jgi:Flp pilus assembly protein TadD
MLRRSAAVFAGLILAGCSGDKMPGIQPIEPQSAHLSRFDSAYAEGKRLMRLDHPGLAAVMFEKALTLDPTSINALNATGAAFDELHAPDLAAPYYARAIALDARNTDTLNDMAVSAVIAGRPAEARALFSRALAIDPKNSVILANRRLLDAPPAERPRERLPTAPTGDDAKLERVGAGAVVLTMPGDPRPAIPALPPLDPLANARK